MRSDVHAAALKAAAKVAFSVAFLGGCSAAGVHEESSQDPTEGTSEDALTRAKKPAAEAGCHEDAALPLTCEQVVAAAFPVKDEYPGKKAPVSKAVAACCVEVLTKSQETWKLEERWNCCGALGAPGVGQPNQAVGMACTPWGPPVPPAMKRKAGPFVPPDAWVGVA